MLRQTFTTLLRTRPLLNKSFVTRPVITRPAVKQAFIRPFSITTPRFGSGDADPDLVHLLEGELGFEKTKDDNEPPAFVTEFLEHNSFQMNDRIGYDKVTLTRLFGNEKISVVFSISDINNIVQDMEESNEQQQEEEEEEEKASFPVRATVIVEKQNKGCLMFNTVAQDGYLHIDAIRQFKEGQINIDDVTTNNIGEQRQDLYMGPVFEELEEEIQATFTRYLEERGIDTALATFLPDYIDYKEQKEYVHWLKDVNDFVSA
ncbi:mitochondrial glycoprotein [Gilbertella persicaria]|uniref:mitochondrial glycoprotein n=1 Tax=Gilbertella persicaria TaxID=101096 RepID=UPI00221F4873|nr:mitochondrial glycoprotein [Gilbertella persicaria]KAI8075878.1 mitochondrial glycoprotein [Gilbertella persicaria]